MTFRLVLDATAVAAYAARSIHVGEVLAEVCDEYVPNDSVDGGTGPLVAVPVAAALRAAVNGADPDRIDVLLGLPYVTCAALPAHDWRRVANATRLLVGLDRACAALQQAHGRADLILTADPDVYGGLDTIGI